MKPFEKWLLLSSAAATALTGVVYAWMRYLLEPVDEWSVIHHPWEPFVLKAHILVAPVLVFAVGAIAFTHIWKHFRNRARQGRKTGIITAAVFVPMGASGYMLQAVTSPGWVTTWLVIHLATGAIFAVGIPLHWREFLRSRRRRRRDRAADPAGHSPRVPAA